MRGEQLGFWIAASKSGRLTPVAITCTLALIVVGFACLFPPDPEKVQIVFL